MYEIYAFLAYGRYVYVGSTKDRKTRRRRHRYNSEFCSDYPQGCFVILESGLAKSQVKEREEYWIAEYQTYANGYNKTSKYRGVHSHTVASLEKMCENNRKRVANGTHHWLGPVSNQKRIENGTHNFLGEKNKNYDTTWEDNSNTTPATRSAWEDADEIVRLNQSGITQTALGKRYKVNRTTIHNIIKANQHLRNSQPLQLTLF